MWHSMNKLPLLIILTMGIDQLLSNTPTELIAIPDNRVPVICAHGLSGSGHRAALPYTRGAEKTVQYYRNFKEELPTNSRYFFDIQHHHVLFFDFADASINLGMYGSLPNTMNAHVAQRNDITTLTDVINTVKSDKKIIGFGYSRGASTWLTTLGSNKELGEEIACIILEAPFAHMHNVALFSWIKFCVDFIHKHFPYFNPMRWNEQIFVLLFNEYKFEDIQPIATATLIKRKDIPILLVHSQQDTIIPINDSRQIYCALQEAGHTNVFLLELPNGYHADGLWGKSGDLYAQAVHELFKQLNLPYNQDYANHNVLSACQPSIEEVKKRIKKSALMNKQPLS